MYYSAQCKIKIACLKACDSFEQHHVMKYAAENNGSIELVAERKTLTQSSCIAFCKLTEDVAGTDTGLP